MVRRVICRVLLRGAGRHRVQSSLAQEASPTSDAGFASRSYPRGQRLSCCIIPASNVIQARPGVAVRRRVICIVFHSLLAQEALPWMGRGCGAGFASRSYPMGQRLSFCRFPASRMVQARPGAAVGRRVICRVFLRGTGRQRVHSEQGLRRGFRVA